MLKLRVWKGNGQLAKLALGKGPSIAHYLRKDILIALLLAVTEGRSWWLGYCLERGLAGGHLTIYCHAVDASGQWAVVQLPPGALAIRIYPLGPRPSHRYPTCTSQLERGSDQAASGAIVKGFLNSTVFHGKRSARTESYSKSIG